MNSNINISKDINCIIKLCMLHVIFQLFCTIRVNTKLQYVQSCDKFNPKILDIAS